MDWHQIQLSEDCTTFHLHGELLYGKQFHQALKFHAPGLAPVCDESGWYHIDAQGLPLYPDRFDRAFGYYCHRATVVKNGEWFHLDAEGNAAYPERYAWTGNFQEDCCTVRGFQGQYFHIDLSGKSCYPERYHYAGDFREGYACVKTPQGFKHINHAGQALNGKLFLDLGVLHKGIATAKDANGWFHMNKQGEELYPARYQMVEPFYNGFSLVEKLGGGKVVIDERGWEVLGV